MEKKFKHVHVKSLDAEKKTISAYVSTFGWDRMDERFAPGSWNLSNFKKNPVVLWAHKSDELPIAKAINISEDSTGLFAEMQFDEQSEFSLKVFSLFQRGFLNTFSVGFHPKSYVMDQVEGKTYKGIVFTDAELLEFSAVPVPANPGAVVSREDDQVLIKSLCGEEFINVKGGFIFSEDKKDRKIEDFELTLKSLMDLAKIAKNEKKDEQRISLIKNAISHLQELIAPDGETIPLSDFCELKSIVDDLVIVLKKNIKDPDDRVSEFMMQFNAALKGYRGE